MRNSILDEFYSHLTRLSKAAGQGRPLCELGRALPARGVYFFFEPGEVRAADPRAMRVVRVGTHAVSSGSKSTLRGRLKQHFGTRLGGGNHRGSIFRLHVGAALMHRDGITLPSWGIGSSVSAELRADEAALAAEALCEERVSKHIGSMPVCWVEVPDEPSPLSDRAFIERNAIALLSNNLHPVDAPTETWLGRASVRREIRESGLWNLNYVADKCEAGFLPRLEELVTRTAK